MFATADLVDLLDRDPATFDADTRKRVAEASGMTPAQTDEFLRRVFGDRLPSPEPDLGEKLVEQEEFLAKHLPGEHLQRDHGNHGGRWSSTPFEVGSRWIPDQLRPESERRASYDELFDSLLASGRKATEEDRQALQRLAVEWTLEDEERATDEERREAAKPTASDLRERNAARVSKVPADQRCSRCYGTGQYQGFGACFACGGTGRSSEAKHLPGRHNQRRHGRRKLGFRYNLDINDFPDWDPRSSDPQMVADQNRVEQALVDALQDGLDTETAYDKVNGIPGKYRTERKRQQAEIVREFVEAPGVRNDAKLLFMGGLPGSGKTTTINSPAGQQALGVNTGEYVVANPDEVKAAMARRGMLPNYEHLGLSRGESATLVHEESTHIAWMIAESAMARGQNLLIDLSLKSAQQFKKRSEHAMDDDGPKYDVTVVFVDVEPATAMRRAIDRYRRGEKRYFPLDMIVRQMDPDNPRQSRNLQAFRELSKRTDIKTFLFDNNGTEPVLVET